MNSYTEPMRSEHTTKVSAVNSVAPRRLPAPARRLTAISLFSGAGGLDLGCEDAGFATRAAIEFNEIARQTLLANARRFLPELTEGSLFKDVVDIDYAELLDAARLAERET